MFRKSFPTFFYYLALASIIVCPCEEYLGIVKLALTEVKHATEKKLNRKQCEFFLGNGIKENDPEEAATKLLFRDHRDVAELNDNYYNGKLGPKFLPPVFLSDIPNVVNPSAYRGVHIILLKPDFKIVWSNAADPPKFLTLRANPTQNCFRLDYNWLEPRFGPNPIFDLEDPSWLNPKIGSDFGANLKS